jgi:two-component system, cell cycle sensor histidine kinase and response regulator CckA
MRAGPDLGQRAACILIVDDDANNRNLLELMLASEGFVLETAHSGEQALACIESRAPDLILLDLLMPGLNGYEVAAKLKGAHATENIPIIMITAADAREARLLGLSAGAEDFLTRPVDRAELCMRVRNLLRLKAYGDHYDKYSQFLAGEVGSRTAELIESEGLYRSTFDAAPVGIVHVGLDGRWLRVNQRLCDLLGYSRDELQGNMPPKPNEVPEETDSLPELNGNALVRRAPEDRRYRRRDGSVMRGRVSTSAHLDPTGHVQHFISVIEDITEQRRLEAQVLQANKMEAIGGLASGVAHDFNNLLSVVLSYSELLTDGLREGDPMRHDLDEIRRAGLRAVELTRQLLAFSRQQVLEPSIVDIGQVVDEMEAMLRRLIGEDVELCVMKASALGSVLVDRGKMEQVVMNLAINSRDAMPAGGKLTIETSNIVLDAAQAAERAGTEPGPHVLLTVRDTGTGMDKATQARIFEPFFTTKGPGKGTGLGLATVFGIIKQSAGVIRVESEPGKGTTFEVYFATSNHAAAEMGASIPLERRILRGTETILLVEDDDSVRALACTILRKYGYDVLVAQSGGDALLLCEQHPGAIELLLTDMVMPRMSGRQLAERLVGVRPEMKVVYMSGYADDAIMRHGPRETAVDFVQKPIRPEALARKVREALGYLQPPIERPTARSLPPLAVPPSPEPRGATQPLLLLD